MKTAHFRLPSASQKRACLSSLIARAEGGVRLDFLKKEKNATKNRHQRAACVGIDKSNTVLMRRSELTVIGCFLAGL